MGKQADSMKRPRMSSAHPMRVTNGGRSKKQTTYSPKSIATTIAAIWGDGAGDGEAAPTTCGIISDILKNS